MSARSSQVTSSTSININYFDKKSAYSQKKLVVGIVAGEASGDKLGAVLMQQMQMHHPNIDWVGVGGQQMQAQGLSTLFDMSRLSVMGLVEVIKHLPDLVNAKKTILSAFVKADIDVFIGIDAPDFNLRLGKALKSERQSVFCVQYVSPSVWAWREGRIKGIKQATDLVLCLFPFELSVYQRHQHPAVCVGHPLLDDIKPTHTDADRKCAIDSLCLLDSKLTQQLALKTTTSKPVILCVMPGSRVGEITTILPKMLKAVSKLLKKHKNLTVIIPTIDVRHADLIKKLIREQITNDNVSNNSLQAVYHILFHQHNQDLSHQAMLASDVVLLASGTATFEAMLLQRPMVVVYQLNTLTYHIAKRLVKVPYVALPNILANQPIVPELIQDAANPSAIADAVDRQLTPSVNQQQKKALQALSDKIRQDSRHNVAQVVLGQYFQVHYE